ncbi:M48 family metallopeptidase [Propionivibrio soli]|uniref:M48 family metallopeptidase n=1 Tax=Propionivibrio soli TaxID=2976531 RepID=UPI0021E6F189|nr:M48 family metallopeptidase [Propionivibrio soli]
MKTPTMKNGALALIVTLFLTGCATTTTTTGGAVGVDRQQTMLVSAAEVNRAAEKAYTQTIGEARAKGLLDRNPAQVQRVRTIAGRLIPTTGVFRPDAPSWRWETHVITSKELNAWCMPGGKIAVYTALMEQLGLSDDELAAVMGHEIAHALREHGREKAGQAAGMDVAAAIGGVLIGSYYGVDPSLGQNVLGTVGDLAFMRPNSRAMEQEADRVGIELVARAGYNPHASISLWEKMARASGNGVPQWLSTHPSHESRIADLRVYADRVDPLYKAAQRNN